MALLETHHHLLATNYAIFSSDVRKADGNRYLDVTDVSQAMVNSSLSNQVIAMFDRKLCELFENLLEEGQLTEDPVKRARYDGLIEEYLQIIHQEMINPFK